MIMLKLKKTFPRKNRERVRSKTVYIVRDWGRILPQQSGEWELARDIVESLAGNLMTKNWRVDYNPQKGVYINIWNYTKGKGIGKAEKIVIPFEGNEETFVNIVNQLNR